jgi:hypothetical protein
MESQSTPIHESCTREEATLLAEFYGALASMPSFTQLQVHACLKEAFGHCAGIKLWKQSLDHVSEEYKHQGTLNKSGWVQLTVFASGVFPLDDEFMVQDVLLGTGRRAKRYKCPERTILIEELINYLLRYELVKSAYDKTPHTIVTRACRGMRHILQLVELYQRLHRAEALPKARRVPRADAILAHLHAITADLEAMAIAVGNSSVPPHILRDISNNEKSWIVGVVADTIMPSASQEFSEDELRWFFLQSRPETMLNIGMWNAFESYIPQISREMRYRLMATILMKLKLESGPLPTVASRLKKRVQDRRRLTP